MNNKVRAIILGLVLGSFVIAPAWAQQAPSPDTKKNGECCQHQGKADAKGTAQACNEACCQNKDKAGAKCCGDMAAKTEAGKDAKTDCCKDAKADCCKDGKQCCDMKDAKLCQTKEGKGCCGKEGECGAKAAAK